MEATQEKLHGSLYDKDTKETIFADLTFEELRGSLFKEFRRMYYSLGGLKQYGAMTCDGHKFPIAAEVNEALRRIRLNDRERIISIDEVSINQQDNTERNQHVKHIGDIYAKADHVIIWLGEHLQNALEGTKVVMDSMRKIAIFIEKSKCLMQGSVRANFLTGPEIMNLR